MGNRYENRFLDLSGNKYRNWYVISFSHVKNSERIWNCKCDCGNHSLVNTTTLLNANYTKCRKCANIKHGGTKNREPEYHVWFQMKQRCYKENNKNFEHYGGRGIKVCDRWITSYDNFISDMGKRPTNKHSLERIDTNGDYTPSNCIWIHISKQNSNTRGNRPVINRNTGEKFDTCSSCAKSLGISQQHLTDMLKGRKNNWTGFSYTKNKYL